MANREKELENYVIKGLKKGFSIAHIKKALLDAGHSEGAVIEAIENSQRMVEPEAIPRKMPVKSLVITASLLIIVVGVLFVSYKVLPELEERRAKEEAARKMREDATDYLIESCVIKYSKDYGLDDCQTIYGDHTRITCLLHKLGTKARLTRNLSMCDKIGELYDVYGEYLEEKDIGEDNIEGCKIVIVSDLESCIEILGSERREDCNLFIGLIEGNIEPSDPRLGNSKDGAIQFLAITNNDIRLCEQIEDSKMKLFCKVQLEQDTSKIRDLCAELKAGQEELLCKGGALC